jgi:hypothetical protein
MNKRAHIPHSTHQSSPLYVAECEVPLPQSPENEDESDMPKNYVTDPITDQEITFAHLLLSGTMNDREAAEAAGLNPTTAAYTKSKPRVRDYMDQHRAAVKEKMVADEAEALRNLNLIRDQFLDRLWELARLSPAETRGSIAGQIKAMAMIGAVVGLLPSRLNDRRPSSTPGQSESPAIKAQMYVAEWRRQNQGQATEPAESVTATEAQPASPPLPEPPDTTANDAPSAGGEDNSFTDPKGVSWVPNAIGPDLDTYPNTTSSFRPPFPPGKRRFGPGR